jgi:hypothetical protein
MVDNASKDDMRSCRAEQIRQGLLCLHYKTLTMSFVDDNDLVCQVYAKGFSSITMKQKVVGQGHYLKNFPLVTRAFPIEDVNSLLLAE